MANNTERDELLAFVSEKYYLEDHRQTDIAEMIGLTRSAVSRMLTEAREKGIVEILIHRPFQYDPDLEDKLKKELGLKYVSVVVFNKQPINGYQQNRKDLHPTLDIMVLSKAFIDREKPRFQANIAVAMNFWYWRQIYASE